MLAIKLRRFFLLPCLVLLLIAQYTAADAVNPSNAIDQRSLVGIGSSGSNSIDDSHSPTKATTDSPTKESTATTTKAPTDSSTKAPTATKETTAPTATPNKAPTNSPTKATTATKETKEPSATTTKAPTGSPTKAPTATNLNPAHNYAGDDEGNGGAIFALILMFSFVGAVWFNRIKIKRLLDATEVFDGMGGESSGPASKVTKYRDLPSEENDEEWGWGDDNDNSGDVELSGAGSTGSTGSYKDEVLHKRHSPAGSFEIKDPAPPAPFALARRTSGGHSPQLKSKPSPQPAKKPVVKPPMHTTQRITSLGKKIPKTPAKPKAAPPQEDDIFASMGLSAKPKFLKPTPGTAKSSAASGGSRWASNTGSLSAAAATTTTTSNTLSAGLSDAGSDDDWGDDDDLNDLLDD